MLDLTLELTFTILEILSTQDKRIFSKDSRSGLNSSFLETLISLFNLPSARVFEIVMILEMLLIINLGIERTINRATKNSTAVTIDTVIIAELSLIEDTLSFAALI